MVSVKLSGQMKVFWGSCPRPKWLHPCTECYSSALYDGVG